MELSVIHCMQSYSESLQMCVVAVHVLTEVPVCHTAKVSGVCAWKAGLDVPVKKVNFPPLW